MLRKQLAVFALSCMMFAGAWASNALDVINNKLIAILQPLQNKSTQSQVLFSQINQDGEHINQIKLSGYYRRAARNHGKYGIYVDNLDYTHKTSSDPIISYNINLHFNLTKILQPVEIDEFINQSLDVLNNLKIRLDEQYPGVADIKYIVTSSQKDKNEHYSKISFMFSSNYNLEKLPEDEANAFFYNKSAVASISFDAKNGLSINGYVVQNLSYYDLNEDEVLIDLLNQLEFGNPMIENEIFEAFKMMNSTVKKILEKNDKDSLLALFMALILMSGM